MSELTAVGIWEDLCAVRHRAPLVHNVTNYVVMNVTANALLAVGASPVMAHAIEEVSELVQLADALVLNIGTLSPDWLDAMRLAVSGAAARGLPSVLDPVGAGATAFRRRAVATLIDAGPPTIIRGNAAELAAVAAGVSTMRGVDSGLSPESAVPAALLVAQRIGGVACISGADDHIVDATGRHAIVSNGYPWMARVTGMGCTASALVGAFAGVQPDAFRATASAMAVLGVAGEIAAEHAAGTGLGTFEPHLLSALDRLDEGSFRARLRLAQGRIGA